MFKIDYTYRLDSGEQCFFIYDEHNNYLWKDGSVNREACKRSSDPWETIFRSKESAWWETCVEAQAFLDGYNAALKSQENLLRDVVVLLNKVESLVKRTNIQG